MAERGDYNEVTLECQSFRGPFAGKQIRTAEAVLKNGEIKSAASPNFTVFDAAAKEMFWIDNPCLW